LELDLLDSCDMSSAATLFWNKAFLITLVEIMGQ